MLVSRVKPGDLAVVQSIATSVWPEMDMTAELAKSYARLWVARPRHGSQPVAFLLAWAVVDELHVLWIATRLDARRQGAGRALVRAAVEYAGSERYSLVLLEVRRDNNAAIRLYRSAGFHAIGLRRGYYEKDAVDAVLMTLNLDPVTGAVLPGRDEVLLGEA